MYLRRTGGDPALAGDPAAFLGFATVNPLGLSRCSGEDMRVRTELLHHVELVADAKQALVDGQFSLAYQPILPAFPRAILDLWRATKAA